jgi:hypothetical protein
LSDLNQILHADASKGALNKNLKSESCFKKPDGGSGHLEFRQIAVTQANIDGS